MAERDSASAVRTLGEQFVEAGLGLLALTAERVDRLADDVADAAGIRRDEAREAVRDLGGRLRGDRVRVAEGTSERVARVFRDLGLVTREEWDELELRVSQLEHRLRLLEGGRDADAVATLPRRTR